MTGDDFLKAKLAETAWRCRRGGGIFGMMAVAFVIRNRVHHLNEPWLTACEAALHQVADEGLIDRADPETRDPEFQQILHAVDGIFGDRLMDKLTNGATQAYAQDTKVPAHVERVAVVGQMVLCK
jgi:hypothetical protein